MGKVVAFKAIAERIDAMRVQIAFMECPHDDCKGTDPQTFNDSGNTEWFVYEGDPDSAYDCPLCGKPGRRYPY